MNCKNCGAIPEAGSAFCNRCGAPMTASSTQPQLGYGPPQTQYAQQFNHYGQPQSPNQQPYAQQTQGHYAPPPAQMYYPPQTQFSGQQVPQGQPRPVRPKENDAGLAWLSGWLITVSLLQLGFWAVRRGSTYGLPGEILADLSPLALIIAPIAIVVLVLAVTGRRRAAGIAGFVLGAFLILAPVLRGVLAFNYRSFGLSGSNFLIRFVLIPIVITLAYAVAAFVLSFKAQKS